MVTYQVIAGFLGTILLALLGWAGSAFYGRLVTIQKDLNDLSLQVAKLQASLISREEMRQMVADEVARQTAHPQI
jgi:hypothetical protein